MKTLLRPKGQKDLSKNLPDLMMAFLLNAERRLDSSLGCLGPGDVKLKRVALKVRRMIEKLQPKLAKVRNLPEPHKGRPLMDLNETVMTSSLSIHHRPATAVTANC